MTDLSILGSAAEIWDEWRFEPWTDGAASGLYRRLSMVKDSLLGEVARYYADDYIIWKYAPEDPARLFSETKPQRDVMTHRFVFLQKEGQAFMRRRSIWLGFRGFVEEHSYTLGSEAKTGVQDLAYLANKAAQNLSF